MIPLLALLSLGQLGRISLLGQELNFYLYEIYLVFYLIWFVAKYKLDPLKKSFKKFKPVYIFAGWLGASFVIGIFNFSLYENLIGLLYQLRLATYFVFFFYLIHHLDSSRVKKNLGKGILTISVITIVLSVIQYLLYPNLRNLEYLGWDPHYFRISGTFLDTSVTAAVFGLLTLFYLLKAKKTRLLSVPLLLLGFLTFSRAFYLASAVASLFYFSVKKNLVAIAVLLILVVAVIIVPKPSGEGGDILRKFTVTARLVDYQKGIEIWQRSPIFGLGYNRIRPAKGDLPQSHAGASFHSSFLIILVSSGVVGLILYCWVLINLAKITQISTLYVVFLAVFSLFDNILLHPFVSILFLTLLANEVSLSRTSE